MLEMAETLQPFCLEAHSLPSGSISFGRFETEPLLWERRSAFSCNNYLEEVERYSKPGSVNQRKAYFEVFFKRKALQQPDSQFQNWTECQSSKGEYVDKSNHTELHRESLFECEESSNCHRDSEVIGKNTPMHEKFSPGLRKSQGESPKVRAESKTPSTRMKTSSSSNGVARDSNKVSKEKISKSHTAKQPVKNISTFKPLLDKIPKSMESRESEKQKYQHARPQKVARSSTEKNTKPSAANIDGNSRGKVKNKDEEKEARIKQMPRISNSKTAKMAAISPMDVPQDSSGEKAVPVHVHAETTKLGRNSSDPVRKVTSGESISRSTSLSIKLPGQPSPSKNKESNLASKHLLRGKQVDTKKRDMSPSQTVTKPSKVPKLQSESSSPSSVCRAPSASSTSSVKQSSKHTDTTESPKKNNLPANFLPEGHEVTAEKHDVDISKTVSRPTRLTKLQNKSSSPSPVRNAHGASSHSPIKQLSSQCTDSTEAPMKNNSPTKCLPGRGEVKAKKHDLDTFQTVSKPTKLATVQSKSSRPSPVLKAPSASSISSSTKQLSSQHTKRTESPMKNKFPTTSLPGGKVVSALKSDLGISQMVSKPTKLAKLKQKSSSPSPVLKARSGSSTTSLKQLNSEFTSRTESPVKNNLPTKYPPGEKEVSATKHDLDSFHTVSRVTKSSNLQRKTSSPVVKAATVSSTSSAVGQFIPEPKKESDVPRKNNEKKFPTTHPPEGIEVVAKNNNHLNVSRSVSKPTQLAKLQQRESSSQGPARKVGSAGLSSIGQHDPKTMKRSETPKKNKNELKQLGKKGHSENPSQCEAVSNKYSILKSNSSSAAKGVLCSTARTNPTKSIGRD